MCCRNSMRRNRTSAHPAVEKKFQYKQNSVRLKKYRDLLHFLREDVKDRKVIMSVSRSSRHSLPGGKTPLVFIRQRIQINQEIY